MKPSLPLDSKYRGLEEGLTGGGERKDERTYYIWRYDVSGVYNDLGIDVCIFSDDWIKQIFILIILFHFKEAQ